MSLCSRLASPLTEQFRSGNVGPDVEPSAELGGIRCQIKADDNAVAQLSLKRDYAYLKTADYRVEDISKIVCRGIVVGSMKVHSLSYESSAREAVVSKYCHSPLIDFDSGMWSESPTSVSKMSGRDALS